MASKMRMIPMSGVDNDSPPCYLLEIDELTFLLDCGCDANFKMDLIDNLKEHIHRIDGVFISHPDLYHIGALPYLVGKLGLSCPIYATIPVFRMGQLFMYDVYQSRSDTENFDLFSLDDVDQTFEMITKLAYNETIRITGSQGTTLQISALPAGHMIGGSIWKINKEEEELVVYGVDYNHRREKHLDGCSFDNIFRPQLFITDSFATNYTKIKRVSRDEQLSNIISKTLKAGGNALISTDTAGRVLEIAYLLEQQWKNPDNDLSSYNLVLLSSVAYNVLVFARSMNEWMSEQVGSSVEMGRLNPFQFKHMQLCHNIEECNKVAEPKVVLASTPDMDSGFSRELFIQWCGNPKNAIILTSLTAPDTLAHSLIDDPGLSKVTLKLKKKVQLEGRELAEFRKKEMRQKIDIKIEEFNNSDGNEEEESDDEDSEWEDPCKTVRHGYNYVVTQPLKRKASYNTLFENACPIIPCKKRKLRQSDFGYEYDPKLFKLTTSTKNDSPLTSSTNPSAETKEMPTKFITKTKTFDIKATVTFIDFDGRSDSEYLKNIISQIKPLQLVLVRGNSSSTDYISRYAESHMPKNGRILIPKLNQTLDCTLEDQTQSVKLSQSLLESLQMKKVKNYEVAWVDAVVAMEESEAPEDEDAENDAGIILDKLPEEELNKKLHDSIFVNNMRLAEFKEILIRQGFKVELDKGVLVINGTTKLLRNAEGSLVPFGEMCPDFWKLLDLISEHYVAL